MEWEKCLPGKVSGDLREQAVMVQSLSCVRLFVIPWSAGHQSSLSFTVFQSLLKLLSLESVMPSHHLLLCCPLLLLPSIFPRIRVFSNKSGLSIREHRRGALKQLWVGSKGVTRGGLWGKRVSGKMFPGSMIFRPRIGRVGVCGVVEGYELASVASWWQRAVFRTLEVKQAVNLPIGRVLECRGVEVRTCSK